VATRQDDGSYRALVSAPAVAASHGPFRTLKPVSGSRWAPLTASLFNCDGDSKPSSQSAASHRYTGTLLLEVPTSRFLILSDKDATMAMTLKQALKRANAVREQQLRTANTALALEDILKGFHHPEVTAHLDTLGEDGDEWNNSITGERW